MNKQRVELYIEQAFKAYRNSDKTNWIAALWASRIVGQYEYGVTLGLAEKLNVEVDTVEDLAHAYKIFEDLGKVPEYRLVVFWARRSDFIYYSHFRVLYEARERYDLTITQVFGYLMDVIQAEGGLTARKLEKLLREKYGPEQDWTWYGENALKAINSLLQRPDLPADVRAVLVPAFNKLGDRPTDLNYVDQTPPIF